MKKLEIVVNARCENDVILGRIRSLDGKSVVNAPTIKFQGETALKGMTKGDGFMIEASGLVQKGNYVTPLDCKIIDTKITGKQVDLDSLTTEVPF